MRMKRVPYYFKASGALKHNTDNLLAPFRLMTDFGDYFEVEKVDCLAGNLSSLCSMYSEMLKRRFQFRTHVVNGRKFYRVTLVRGKGEKANKDNVQKRQTPRIQTGGVSFFTTLDGKMVPNTDVNRLGRPMKYPLRSMQVGSWFDMKGTADAMRAVSTLAYIAGKELGVKFKAERSGDVVRVTRTT